MINNNTLIKIKDKIKENIFSLSFITFIASIVSYISSKIFIKSYIELIGFNSLNYSELYNNDATLLLFFGIAIIITLSILSSTIIPASLRYLYLESLLPLNNFSQKVINIWITISFTLIFISCTIFLLFYQSYIVFLITPIFYMLIIVYKLYNNHILYNNKKPILRNVIFNTPEKRHINYHIIIFEKYNFSIFKYATQLIIVEVLFSCILTLLILPNFMLILLIHNSHFFRSISESDWLTIMSAFIIWLIYSLFYANRITKLSNKHYIYDIFSSIIIIYLLFIINPIAFIVTVSEFVGIKDSTAKIYKVSNENYQYIKKDIDALWKYNKPCSYNKDDKSCLLLTTTYKNPDYTYLNTQVIFRDNKNAVICPPNFDITKDMQDRCFRVDLEILEPTSQTTESLNKNINFTKNFYTFID